MNIAARWAGLSTSTRETILAAATLLGLGLAALVWSAVAGHNVPTAQIVDGIQAVQAFLAGLVIIAVAGLLIAFAAQFFLKGEPRNGALTTGVAAALILIALPLTGVALGVPAPLAIVYDIVSAITGFIQLLIDLIRAIANLKGGTA